MSGELSFTGEELKSAIHQLKSRKQAVNGASLRAIVGKGRPSALMQAYQSLIREGEFEISDNDGDNLVMQARQVPPQAAELQQQLIQSIETLVLMISDSVHSNIEKEYMDWVAAAKNESNQLATQIEQLHLELEAAYKEIQAANESISALKDQCQQNDSSLIESRAELNKLDKVHSKIDQERQQFHQELVSTKKQLAVSVASMTAANTELVQLKTQLNEKTTQLESFEQSSQQRQNQIEAQQHRIGQLESHLAQESATKTQLSQTNLELNKQVTRAIDENKTMSRELYYLQHSHTELKAELLAYKQEAEQLKEAMTISIANERNVEKQLADLRLKTQQQEKEFKLCEQELYSAKGVISALQVEEVESLK